MSSRAIVFGFAVQVIAAVAVGPAAIAAENTPAAKPKPAVFCDLCGVVRSVRRIEKPVPPKRDLLPGMAASAGSDSMNAGMQAAPQFSFGGGSGVQRIERQPLTRDAWEIIVRYDNGQFGMVTADTEPMLQVGDRVRNFENNLELLPATKR